MAFDALGNLYVVNYGAVTNQAIKIDLADVPALAFATSTQVGSTDSADGTLTATVKNNGNEPLAISGLTIAGNSFQLDASTTTCAVATTVQRGLQLHHRRDLYAAGQRRAHRQRDADG